MHPNLAFVAALVVAEAAAAHPNRKLLGETTEKAAKSETKSSFLPLGGWGWGRPYYGGYGGYGGYGRWGGYPGWGGGWGYPYGGGWGGGNSWSQASAAAQSGSYGYPGWGGSSAYASASAGSGSGWYGYRR